MKEKRSTVLGGIAVLTLAGILVKAIGLFYKIPLTYLLGDEGLGYFNAAYTIYAWLYMLSTAGLPIAVSILISEARAREQANQVARTVRLTGRWLFAIGSVTSVALLLLAGPLARILGTQDAAYTIAAIAPTLLFVCVTSHFRGVFQGYQNMVPTAVSQLIEAFGKLGIGMGLAYLGWQRGLGLPVVSALAVLGVTLGTALGTLYLAVRYAVAKRRGELAVGQAEEVEHIKIGRRLWAIALPITVSASVMSLTGLIDLGMVIRRLGNAGFTVGQATALYGNYTTLVVPMFHLPSVLISPIATGIVPALSAAYSAGSREEAAVILGGAYRVSALLGMPCAVGIAFFAKPILALLYPAASVESAYTLLVLIAPAIYFVSVLTVSNAALQGAGNARLPMVSMVAGAVVKIAVGYVLLGHPAVAMRGAPIGTALCYAVALVIDLSLVLFRLGYTPSLGAVIVKPLLSSLLSIGPCALLYYRVLGELSPHLGVLICIALAVILYFLVSLSCGLVRQEDLGGVLAHFKRKRRQGQP
ncbi:MAG: polysaccharide biosynthesis protein [Clostridia bacterium]|nr:polysaccharide biosynthesis protein [Clostridia bacterium]